jgi:hypothetical protein
MPPNRHTRSAGCWICKLRRKKCDESRPTCGDCASLKIECQYGLKPSWMDGGALQKQKAALLKEVIKQNTAHKRERAQNSGVTAPEVAIRRFDVISDITVAAGTLSTQSTAPPRPSDQASAHSSTATQFEQPALMNTLPWSYQQHQRSDTLDQASASEWNFIMKYIDFVFPATFPFYQPHIFDTGRSWLLLLLRKNKIAYHAALGLSCYYFTMALSDAEAGNEHAACKQMRWEEADSETGKCFDSLRADISALSLSQGGIEFTTLEKVELMNSITQVIIFEVSMGKSRPWDTHLPAALKLFEDIMATSEARPVYLNQPQSKFSSILLGIGDPLWTNSWPSNHIWSPEQTGFRFCAGYLIFIDIMASTALGETPHLARYYADVLARIDDGEPVVGEAEIRLSAIVGCRNWIATSLAEVCTVAEWKRAHGSSRRDVRMINRIANVAKTQKWNIHTVKEHVIANAISYPSYGDVCDPASLDLGRSPPMASVITLIWGLAAEIYRLTVDVGWDLEKPDIQSNVAHIAVLLSVIPLDQLRTLAWPICVAGCLARENEEAIFTALFAKLGRVQTVGSLSDAQQLIESAWRNRSTLDQRGHDLASGLAALHSPILIV